MRKSVLKKFLATFTTQSATGQYIPQGVNGSNLVQIKVTIPAAMTATQTLGVQLPNDVDFGFLPIAEGGDTSTTGLQVVNITPPASPPGSYTYNVTAGFQVTSHNSSTGITTLTAMGSISAGDIIFLWYCAGGNG